LTVDTLVLDGGHLALTGRAEDEAATQAYSWSMYVARVDLMTGALDPSFGNGGATLIDVGKGEDYGSSSGQALMRQLDGKLVVVGNSNYGDRRARRWQIAVSRVDPRGHGSPGIVGFADQSVAVVAGEIPVRVRRSGGSFGPATVDYETFSNGVAVSPRDFTAVTGTLAWMSGEIEDKIIRVQLTQFPASQLQLFGIRLMNGSVPLAWSTRGLSTSSSAPTTSPTPAPPIGSPRPSASAPTGASGGSGALDLVVLLMLATAAVVARRNRERRASPRGGSRVSSAA
jgi:hypothetical protein